MMYMLKITIYHVITTGILIGFTIDIIYQS